MNVLRNKKLIRGMITDYKKIYHSKTIRDLIENGSINGNKSNLIKDITNVYDNNDKLKFSVTINYVDGLDKEIYNITYVISESSSIDDKIKDCYLSEDGIIPSSFIFCKIRVF